MLYPLEAALLLGYEVPPKIQTLPPFGFFLLFNPNALLGPPQFRTPVLPDGFQCGPPLSAESRLLVGNLLFGKSTLMLILSSFGLVAPSTQNRLTDFFNPPLPDFLSSLASPLLFFSTMALFKSPVLDRRSFPDCLASASFFPLPISPLLFTPPAHTKVADTYDSYALLSSFSLPTMDLMLQVQPPDARPRNSIMCTLLPFSPTKSPTFL